MPELPQHSDLFEAQPGRVPVDAARVRPPVLPDALVDRRVLVRQLSEAATRKLVVIAAPPGYGKSVLLSSWAGSASGRAVAWFTIDPSDDAASVAAHLCATLSRVDGRPRSQIADLAGGRGMGADFVSALLGTMATLPPTTLVLDDFHSVNGGYVLDDLASIIELAPPHLRFIVSARRDPPLPYHRLRLIDQVAELRAEDLRFGVPDAADLLERLAGRGCTEAQVALLVTRTEGWVTGLQLAALSLRSLDDIDGFIERFAGGDRHVAEYLTEHVLGHMAPDLREFLLRTSVLDRLSGSLCDAVTGRRDSEAVLQRLDHASLFVTSVDYRGEWFQCHQLFRDLLRSHLRVDDPGADAELVRRAATWYLDRDDIETAGSYIAVNGDDVETFDFVRAHARSLCLAGRIDTVLPWIAALSLEFRKRPEVALVEAACHMLAGANAAATSVLDSLTDRDALCDQDHLLIDVIITWSVRHEPATDRVLHAADRVLHALEVAPEEEPPDLLGMVSAATLRTGSLLARATAALFEGSHELARSSLEAVSSLPHGSTGLEIDELGLRALAGAWNGSLRSAEQQAKRAVFMAEQAGMEAYPGTSIALLAAARVAREQRRATRAKAFLETARPHLQQVDPTLLLAAHVAESALVTMADGDPEGGLAIIAEHRQATVLDAPPWLADQVDHAEVRLLVAMGDLSRARQVADRLPGTSHDTLDVKLLVATERDDLSEAKRLFARWPETVTYRSRMQELIWQCILGADSGDARSLTEDRLDGLLKLANGEGHMQVLLDAGHHGRQLFRDRYTSAPTPFLRRVVEAPSPWVAGAAADSAHFVEQVTEREMMVLRYLPTRLDNAEIAAELGISVNTLKTHLKHIFRKLGVRTRRAAVEIAEKYRLL